jgi:hypothetical protein
MYAAADAKIKSKITAGTYPAPIMPNDNGKIPAGERSANKLITIETSSMLSSSS